MNSGVEKDWNFVMSALNGMVDDNNECVALAPIYSGPIPGWLPEGKCYSIESPTRLDGQHQAFGYQLPSIGKILEESYFVQHYYESAFKGLSNMNKA